MAKWTRKTTLALVELSESGREVYIDGAGNIRCPSPSLIASQGGRPPAGWKRFVDDPRTRAELNKDAGQIARDRLMAALAADDERENLKRASRTVSQRGKRRKDSGGRKWR